MVIFRLNFFFLQDNYIGDVSFSKCVTSGGIYDCPLLAMLLLVIWLRWCIYLYVVSYIHINKSHSYCVCTQKLSIRTDCAAGGSRFPRLLGNPSNHVRSTASPRLFYWKITSQNQRAPTPTHPNLFPSAWVRLRSKSPGGPFKGPTASFSALFGLGWSFSPQGSLQGAKRAPAGKPRAGHGAAEHVSGLPGESPQPPEPLIGFQAGACLGPRASFRLVGAESGDCGTMAPVHGDECELGALGVGLGVRELWP